MAAAAEKVDKKKEAQELKTLLAKARDPSSTVSFGVSLGKGKEELAFMAHRKKASKVLRKEAKAKTGSSKCTMGRLKLDGKVLTLDCLEEPPSKLKRLLKLYFKDRNLPYKVAIALNGKTVDGEGDEEDEDEAVAAAGGNAEAGAEAETGAEAMDDDFLDDIMGAVADETGASQDEVEAAMDDDMLDDIAAAVEEAGGQEQAPAAEDFLDDDMFDDIAAATTDENAAGGDAGAEEQPGSAAQKQSAEAEKVAKAIDNRKAFKNAREIWIKARNQVTTDLQTIKTGAYNKYMDDTDQFKTVRKGFEALEAEIKDELSEDLPMALNAYVSTPLRDTAKMEALAEDAKAMIANFKKFVDTNKLVAAIDQKEFADCTIKAPLKKALNDLERAIV